MIGAGAAYYDYDGTPRRLQRENQYFAARREYIWHLRTNNQATYAEISRRLSISKARAVQIVNKCERLLKWRGSIHG